MFTQFLDPNYVSAVNARNYSAYDVIMRKADNSGFAYTTLGTAAFSATSAFDASGSAVSALSLAQAYTASALAAFTGTSNITTLGTIATGTWAATTLAIAHGGTGQTTAATAINALLPSQTGQSGNFLTTDGTSASWGAAGGGSGADPTASVGLTAVNGSATTFLRSDGAPALDVSIAPTWTGQHAFIAAADANTGIVIRGHSATQSAALQQWQSSDGYNSVSMVTAGLNGSSDNQNSAAILLSTKNGRNVCSLTAQGTGLTAPLSSSYFLGLVAGDTEVANIRCGYYFGGPPYIQIAGNSSGHAAGFALSPNDLYGYTTSGLDSVLPFSGDNTTWLGWSTQRWAGFASCQVIIRNATAGTVPLIVCGAASQSVAISQFQGLSSTAAVRAMAEVDAVWNDNTDATRSADLVLRTYYTSSALEGIRVRGTSGGAAIAFLGGTPAVQQANASQTAITAVLDANAQSALQAIYNLLAAYNLAPATA